MVVMPLPWASCSIAAPEAESRLVIISTLMPLLSMLSAMVFILPASFCAFWMSQLRFTFAHSAFSASGSEVTQRWEDWVSGRMMPTLAPLPFRLPPEEPPLPAEFVLVPPDDAEFEFEVELFFDEEHALTARVAAAPTTRRPSALLRMGSAAFRMCGPPRGTRPAAECCRREHIPELAGWQRPRHRVVTPVWHRCQPKRPERTYGSD